MDTIKEEATIDGEEGVNKEEEIDHSKFNTSDSTLTEEELGKIVKFGRRLSCNLVKEATTVAAETVSVTSEEMKYYSLSEYSAYLISRILNDGLNGFNRESVSSLSNGDSNELSNFEGGSVCETDDENTETFSIASSEDTVSVKSRNSWDSSKYSDSNRASVASTLSQCSCQSEGFVDNAIESPNSGSSPAPTLTVTQFNYSVLTENKEVKGATDGQQVAEQRRNRDYKANTGTLESIKETSESSENGEFESKPGYNGGNTFSETKTRNLVNGYDTELRNSSANYNSKSDYYRSRCNAHSSSGSCSERKDSTTSEHTTSSRKESSASCQSMESNSDESEERDVLGESFKGKRETSEKSKFGSSVRQHVMMKKVHN